MIREQRQTQVCCALLPLGRGLMSSQGCCIEPGKYGIQHGSEASNANTYGNDWYKHQTLPTLCTPHELVGLCTLRNYWSTYIPFVHVQKNLQNVED